MNVDMLLGMVEKHVKENSDSSVFLIELSEPQIIELLNYANELAGYNKFPVDVSIVLLKGGKVNYYCCGAQIKLKNI